MLPLWRGTLLIPSLSSCPSWHPEDEELSSHLLSPQEEQGFVAASKSKAEVSQKGSLLEGTRESLTHSRQCL